MAVAPSFSLTPENAAVVARICKRLDGIPLAIELAAARVKVLSVDEIATRLADVFQLLSSGSRTLPRHRTIRETIDWSYRLLCEDEQVLLRRLAVFSGTFSLDAAEAVCGDQIDVLDLLAALVDKSLVLRDDSAGAARYRLLETVRQFAAEKLAAAGERDRFRERHARHFYEMTDALEPKVFAGASDPPTLARIDREIDNIRAVFEWCEEDPSRAELELRLLWALHWYWFARGHFNEARRRISAGVKRAAGVDPVVRARALVARGDLDVWQGDWRSLVTPMLEAIEVLRETPHLRATATALMLLANGYAFGERDVAKAIAAFDESERIARINGRNVGLAMTLYWAGIAAQFRGDLGTARMKLEETHAIGVFRDNRPAMGHSMTALGHIALQAGHCEEAIRCFEKAFAVHSEVDDRWGLTQTIEGIGMCLLDGGDAESGTRLLAAAATTWMQLGARSNRQEESEREKDERIRHALSDDRLRVALASGAAMQYDQMVALAREKLGELAARSSSPASTSARPSLRVRALGTLEIERDGQAIESAAHSGRSRELLLFLLCHPAGCTKEQIGSALWPDADPAKLRNNFHVTIHRLRKVLGGAEWIVIQGDTYSLERRHDIDFDVERFERDARAALRLPENSPEAIAHLAEAVEIYRGDFFENGGAGEWHLVIRDRLRELYASALVALGRARVVARDFAAAARDYERLLQLDSLDEQACRNLMTCLARQGDTAAASRAYRRLTQSLRRELDTEPDPATTRLHAKIVAGEVA